VLASDLRSPKFALKIASESVLRELSGLEFFTQNLEKVEGREE